MAAETAGGIVRACPAWGQMNIGSLLAKFARSRPDSLFAEQPDGTTTTYAQLDGEVNRLTGFFPQSGYGPGDCILLRAGRRIEGRYVMLAAARAGLDLCLVAEGLSARQLTDGAVAHAPKLAIDAGVCGEVEEDGAATRDPTRLMESAAGLFTVRLVGRFGDGPDGTIDLGALPEPEKEVLETNDARMQSARPEQHGRVHMLRIGTDGRVTSISRTQGQLLSQVMACAMASGFLSAHVIGTAYDPVSPHGLMAAMLPTLMVGGQVRLFDPLEPDLTAMLRLWLEEEAHNRLVLPAALATEQALAGIDPVGASSNRRRGTWIAQGPMPRGTEATGGTVLCDCGGLGLVQAFRREDGASYLKPGPIVVSSSTGEPMRFGTVKLSGAAKPNSQSGELTSGELLLEGALAAKPARRGLRSSAEAENDRSSAYVPTGMPLRLGDGDDGKPVYLLLAGGETLFVGGQAVSLFMINRALGLTGRWNDAIAFPVDDPMLGHRVEVAVEPRPSQDGTATWPELDDVRGMLRDSGIGDGGLPVKMHLVREIPLTPGGTFDPDGIEAQRLYPELEEEADGAVESDLDQAVA
ncbi:MAG: AMP-binding protein [Cohaesibacteraceae bacterium]